MQKTKGVSERIRPHLLIRIIEDSKIPLEEEESKLQKVKGKVEHDEQLSREDDEANGREDEEEDDDEEPEEETDDE